MNVRFRTPALLLAAQLAILAWAGALSADESIPCERRLPRDVVAYVSFRNAAELRAQWEQTLTSRLWRDESMAEFRAGFETQLVEMSQKIQEHVGLTLMELLDIPHGELAAAMTVSGNGKLSVVLLLDFGDKMEAVNKVIDKLDEGAADQELARAEEDFEQTKLVIYRRPAEDDNLPPLDAVAYFIKDTFLTVGNGPAALKSVLNRWDGKHDNTLAENPVFRYVADKTRDEQQQAAPLMMWYVDPLGLVKSALAANPQTNPQFGLMMTMLPLLGVDQFKGLGGSFDMARGDFDMVSRTLVYFEPPARGALNLFQFDVAGQAPPKWVTDQSSSYTAVNWSIAKAYVAAESLVDSFQGAGAFSRLIQQLADSEQSGGVHLKKDLIDQLTGKVHVVSESAGSDDDDETEIYLVAAEVTKVAGAKATLRKIAQIPGVQVKEREFQGETIYEIGDDDGEDARPMGIVVAENHLLFATDVKLLERVLRGTEGREALADTPSFQRVAKRFPEKTASIGYNREDNAVRSFLAQVNSPAMQRFGPEIAELVSKLPSAGILKEFMTASGSYMQPDERGFRMTSFSLKKEAE